MAANKQTGKRCVAYGCGNRYANDVSLFTFPNKASDFKRQRQWVNFVKTKRKHWKGPAKHTVLCEEHFSSECFPQSQAIQIFDEHHRNNKESNNRKRTFEGTVKSTQASVVPLNKSEEHEDQSSVEEAEDPMCTSIFSPKKIKCFSVKVQVRPNVTNQGIQCEPAQHTQRTQCQIWSQREWNKLLNTSKPTVCENGVQCDQETITQETYVTHEYPNHANESDKDISFNTEPDQLKIDDPSFNKSDSHSSFHTSSFSDVTEDRFADDKLFLIAESKLRELCTICAVCASPCLAEIFGEAGTLIRIRRTCGKCLNSSTWSSQPFVGSVPLGNIRLSSAILLSGSTPTKSLRVFNFMGVPVINRNAFMRHQRLLLLPAITAQWSEEQEKFFTEIKKQAKPISIGGDGRCDTPGHSAKFGSYTIMELSKNHVLDVQLVQCNEVKNSNGMEKEGLIRSIEKLKKAGISIDVIVTDRHVQIVKWIRENMEETTHKFDAWHVAKGLKKKLHALANERECGTLHDWIKSIINHLYWVAASSNCPQEMLQKWQSLSNHLINIHVHEKLDKFPKCIHEDLSPRSRNKKWFRPGTKVCEKLQDVLTSKHLQKDIKMISGIVQTSSLEGFHAVINHFAPKMIGFSYSGMKARLILAALHFNENNSRKQAKTKDGQDRFNIVFPKFKQGEHTIRPIKVATTFGYVGVLQSKILQVAYSSNLCSIEALQDIENNNLDDPLPPPLTIQYVIPDKIEAINSWRSRFART